MDNLFSSSLPWYEIPRSRAHLVEVIIHKLKLLASEGTIESSFLGDNFIREIQNFTENVTFQFPTAAGEAEARAVLDFGTSELNGAIYLGVLLQGSAIAAFRNSLSFGDKFTSLGTEAIHYSKLSGNAKLNSIDLYLTWPPIEPDSFKVPLKQPYLSNTILEEFNILDDATFTSSCSVYTEGDPEFTSYWTKKACKQEFQV